MVLHLEYFDNVLPAILTMVELVDVSLQIFQDEMTLLSAHVNVNQIHHCLISVVNDNI